uniref:Uncharacterized protein n=1 Tax=Anguilla anguilla TaxID=7936 RepID=A0A0E9UQI2_ANGAN
MCTCSNCLLSAL